MSGFPFCFHNQIVMSVAMFMSIAVIIHQMEFFITFLSQWDGRGLQEFHVVSHVPMRKNIRDQFDSPDAVSDRDILCMGKYNSGDEFRLLNLPSLRNPHHG